MNDPDIRFQEGDAVITPDGRIGMVCRFVTRFVLVQFGAAGPVSRWSPLSLRHATIKEVKDAGMYGTGFNILEERSDS